MKLTLVVPCFNEEESVIEFYSEVTRVFKDKVEDYELVFVNDGSRDKTPQILRAIYEKADNVKVVNFSRNFGKEAAIYAGLKQSSGDYTCVIDADLQQRPEVVLEMKQILDENADIDCVAAYQGERKESKLLIFFIAWPLPSWPTSCLSSSTPRCFYACPPGFPIPVPWWSFLPGRSVL